MVVVVVGEDRSEFISVSIAVLYFHNSSAICIVKGSIVFTRYIWSFLMSIVDRCARLLFACVPCSSVLVGRIFAP